MSGACASSLHHACPVVLQARPCGCACHTVVAQ